MKARSIAMMLAVGLAAGIQAQQAQGNLIVNGGFENGGAPWGSFGSAGFHSFFGSNGHASLFADNVGNFGGVFQTGIAGTPGADYEFALLDTRIESNFDASLRFGLEFYDATDSIKISEVLVAIPDPGVEINGAVYTMTATAPVGTVFVRPIISFDNVMSSGGNRNVFVFDSSLNVIPEPTSLALLSVPALALLRRRRA